MTQKKKETRGGHPNCGRKKKGDYELRVRIFKKDREEIKEFIDETLKRNQE